MLTTADTPTRLIDPSERPPVVLVDPQPPTAYRFLYVVGKFVSLLLGLAGVVIGRRLTTHEYARRVRQTFEELGGLWIKFGQLLSLRIDVLPPELCRELARMQEQPVGFPFPVARRIVEAELGSPLEHYFDEFEEQPFAAVPIGQVHRARLRRDGSWVAVKVQQPYSAELFARDRSLIRLFARILTRLRIRLHLRWDEGVAELEQIMVEDLDFRFEASAMRRMHKTLKDHNIDVPHVYSEFCTPRVLVTEYIHAVLMSDYLHVRRTQPDRLQAWLTQNNIDPRRVARNLFNSLFRQIFEDNLYHGDMRPKNIVLLRNSRIALIDFRSVNFTEREYLQKYRLFIRALATRDYAKAADLAMMLCAILPHADMETAKEEVIRVLRAWATRTLVKELPYHECSIDTATAEIVGVLYSYKCTMGWFWLRIHRAMATLDDSLAVLHPQLNHTKRALQYFRRADVRSGRGLATRDTYSRIVAGIRSAVDISERINEYTMFQVSIVRRNARVFQASTSKVAEMLAALVHLGAIAILLVGVMLFGILLGLRSPEWTRAIFGPQLAGLISAVPALDGRIFVALVLADVYVFVTFLRLRRRLRQKDIRSHERAASL